MLLHDCMLSICLVFLWVPSLIKLNNAVPGSEPLPIGLIFSCFMLAMTCGGMLSNVLCSLFGKFSGERLGTDLCGVLTYLAAALAMLIPLVYEEFTPIFIAFLILENSVGMFNAWGGVCRTAYYPESHHSAMINIFRVPLNLIVVTGTTLTSRSESFGEADHVGTGPLASYAHVFMGISCLHIVAALFQLYLCDGDSSKPKIPGSPADGGDSFYNKNKKE